MFPLEFRGQFLSSICICRDFLMITSEWTLKVAAGNQLFGFKSNCILSRKIQHLLCSGVWHTQLKVSVTLIWYNDMSPHEMFAKRPNQPTVTRLCVTERQQEAWTIQICKLQTLALQSTYTRLLQLGHLADAACFCLLAHPCMTQLCERPRLGRDVAIVSTIPPKKAPLY